MMAARAGRSGRAWRGGGGGHSEASEERSSLCAIRRQLKSLTGEIVVLLSLSLADDECSKQLIKRCTDWHALTLRLLPRLLALHSTGSATLDSRGLRLSSRSKPWQLDSRQQHGQSSEVLRCDPFRVDADRRCPATPDPVAPMEAAASRHSKRSHVPCFRAHTLFVPCPCRRVDKHRQWRRRVCRAARAP